MCTTDCLHTLSEEKENTTGKESWQLTLPRKLAEARFTVRSFPVNRLCFLFLKNKTKQNRTAFLESFCTVFFFFLSPCSKATNKTHYSQSRRIFAVTLQMSLGTEGFNVGRYFRQSAMRALPVGAVRYCGLCKFNTSNPAWSCDHISL